MNLKSLEFNYIEPVSYKDVFFNDENKAKAHEVMARSIELAQSYVSAQKAQGITLKLGKVDTNNPGWQYCESQMPGDFNGWTNDGSTATKVEAAYNPDTYKLPITGMTIGKTAFQLLGGAEAAHSLRHRKATVVDLLSHDSKPNDAWAIFAAGGGAETFEALGRTNGSPSAILSDFDSNGIRLIAERIKSENLMGRVEAVHRNLLSPFSKNGYVDSHLIDIIATSIMLHRAPFLKKMNVKMPLERFQRVELGGMLDYVMTPETASRIIRNTYAHVSKADGASGIYTMIRESHPDREWFDAGIPGFPAMNYRTDNEIEEVFSLAKTAGADIVRVDCYPAGAGYLVCEVFREK